MFLKKIYNFFLHLLFPVNCLICNFPGSYFCNKCFKKIKILNLKHKNTKYLDGIYIASSYQNKVLKELIISFKYKYIISIGVKLGSFLSFFFNAKLMNLYFSNRKLYQTLINSYLTYIPSKNTNKRKRGFCQSEILMNQVVVNCNLKYLNTLKVRSKRKRQASLNKKQRIKNINNSFKIKNRKTINIIKSKDIIIVDDVITTGSTINEAAKTLKEAGARKVYGLVLVKNN
ncbi:MAG: phosphoribosyltransferase family protein [Patescibacteria group bacterium]|jgi:competence protein ComFC|nr:phosphoribosyltransferase family protein [Patescibacteria group bacterium]